MVTVTKHSTGAELELCWLLLWNLKAVCAGVAICVIGSSRTFCVSNYICMLVCTIWALLCWLILFCCGDSVCVRRPRVPPIVFPGPTGWFATVTIHLSKITRVRGTERGCVHAAGSGMYKEESRRWLCHLVTSSGRFQFSRTLEHTSLPW